jgi:hypothetical protein
LGHPFAFLEAANTLGRVILIEQTTSAQKGGTNQTNTQG